MSRRILLAALGALSLVAVSSASGVPIDGYTAAGAPSQVRPSTQTTFTITLTNDAASKDADRAKIGIPADFVVADATVEASTSAAGGCAASKWVAEGALIADGKIHLQRPAGSATSRLCAGATLTVVFSATSSATEGSFVWETQLLRGEEPFVLAGPQPGVRVDGTPPTVAIGSHPANPSNDPSASFGFSAAEPATFHCNLDDRGFEPCSAPASYSGLGEGVHAFVVRATDAVGNAAAASHVWTVDVTAPQTTLNSSPPSTTRARFASFTFSSSEPAVFQCRLDGASFSPCGSPKAYSGLGTGRHRFEVRATDPAGNAESTPAAREWTISRARRAVAVSALFAPAAGARVTRPPVLRWRAISRATFYNVQLYRAGRKILTAWPTRARLRLRTRWTFKGRVERLEPGSYRWYVWPGYERAPRTGYGRLIGTSTFVVVRSGR